MYSGNGQFVKTRCWANPPSAPGAETSWIWQLSPFSHLSLKQRVPGTSSSQVFDLYAKQSSTFPAGSWDHTGTLSWASTGFAAGPARCECPGGDASLGAEPVFAPCCPQPSPYPGDALREGFHSTVCAPQSGASGSDKIEALKESPSSVHAGNLTKRQRDTGPLPTAPCTELAHSPVGSSVFGGPWETLGAGCSSD